MVAVKVLDADGAGTNSGVIQGLNFVATNATARRLAGKAVLNMSIGGSKSTALNSAIAALTKAGVVVVVAAGNDNVRLAPPLVDFPESRSLEEILTRKG
jgi:subtilisin family serine protease